MSRPGNPDAAEAVQARQYRAPAVLLEKLMVAVRPEFRADDLVFDPRDPVFGGPPCAVSGCGRPHRNRGLCESHWDRWRASGRPDLAGFTAAAEPGWRGHLPLDACVIAECDYGAMARGLCQRHVRQWYSAGRPDLAAWQSSAVPLPPPEVPAPACRISYCSLWSQVTSVFCHGHGHRWKSNVLMRTSSPHPARTLDTAVSTSACGGCPPGCAWRCSTCCSAAVTSRPPGCRPERPSRS